MTKIETLVKLIDQSSINCHGVDCRECPFEGLANGRIICALLHLNDANAEDITIKKAIIAAVDEAREEEPDPKTGEWWRLKADTRNRVKIVDGNYQLCGKRIVKYEIRGCCTLGKNIEEFLELYEKEDGPKAELEVFNEYERQRKIWLAGRFNALDWVTSVMETEMRKVK